MPAPMTTRQVAEYIGITQKTVLNQIRRGSLPAVRMGRCEGSDGFWLVKVEDAQHYKKFQKGNVGRPKGYKVGD